MVFAEDVDFQRYLDDLGELQKAFGVKIHGYYLMASHCTVAGAGEVLAGLGPLMKGRNALFMRAQSSGRSRELIREALQCG